MHSFFGIGLLATLFPQLPGNGKGPSQLGFDGDLGLTLAIGLLALKVLAVMATLPTLTRALVRSSVARLPESQLAENLPFVTAAGEE